MEIRMEVAGWALEWYLNTFQELQTPSAYLDNIDKALLWKSHIVHLARRRLGIGTVGIRFSGQISKLRNIQATDLLIFCIDKWNEFVRSTMIDVKISEDEVKLSIVDVDDENK